MKIVAALTRRLEREEQHRQRLRAELEAPGDPRELDEAIVAERARVAELETAVQATRLALEKECDEHQMAIDAWLDEHAESLRAELVSQALQTLSGLSLIGPHTALADLPRLVPEVQREATELVQAATEKIAEIVCARAQEKHPDRAPIRVLERDAQQSWIQLESSLRPAMDASRSSKLRESAWELDARALQLLLSGPLAGLSRDAAVEADLGLDEEPAELRGLIR